ncbi:MAG: permease-like cell division protein FtsX [Clostridiales bacterium]|nr:permease-like cell division protein FtsX [Clostridiales bacterium]
MRYYSISETLKSLFRNRMMSFASISSVAASLLILGIIMSVILNINSFSEGIKHQFDSIDVYLQEDLTKDEILTLGDNIQNINGVHSVIFETKEQALENLKIDFEDYSYLLEGLEYNPFPNTYIINLKNVISADSIVNQLKNLKGIEEVKYYKDLISRIIDLTSYVRNIGLILTLFLAAIATFIINNTIKLTINARKREISIMKYIGATSWYIRLPFIMEGTILGFIGALISTGIIYLIYSYSFQMLTTQFYVIFAAYVLNVKTIVKEILTLNIIIGTGIGALGSMVSIRKYLNV